MFKPKKGNARPPAMAPIFTIEPKGVETFLDSSGSVNDTTKSAYLAMIMVIAKSALIVNKTNISEACSLMFTESSASRVNSKKTIIAGEPDLDKIADRAEQQIIPAKQWIVDLVTASKKKELTAENVEGYYASLGRTDIKGGPISKLINSACNFLTDMITDKTFRDELTDTEFMRYHTSRVSTGKLLWEMIDVFKDLKIGNDKDYKKIEDSNDAPYDIKKSKEIPIKMLGYAKIYFEVANKDVGKWYQGEKAMSEVPSVRTRKIKEVFKKYLDVKNNIEELDKANTMDDLTKALGNAFF